MGAWGILALVVAAVLAYLLIARVCNKRITDDDGDWFPAVPDDHGNAIDPDNGITWYPDFALPAAKGQYWTRHPEAPNHVFEGTRWNGTMWISEDGHPCYFQQREWAHPVEQAAA